MLRFRLRNAWPAVAECCRCPVADSQSSCEQVRPCTVLLLAEEADTSALHRAALQSPRAEHTALTNLFSGGYARGIVNRFIREAGPISPVAPPFPLAQAASAPLKAAAEAQGSDEFSSLWAGQNAPLARAETAADTVARLAAAFDA